jgi:molybdenum cofactor guanylyltransferase
MMTGRIDASAAVLAGGRGMRMGGCDKTQLSAGGETFLERKLRQLLPLFEEVLVSVGYDTDTRNVLPDGSLREQVRFAADAQPGYGPLGGLAASLAAARTSLLFITTVDAPGLEQRLVRWMAGSIGSADALVPLWRGNPEPLFAFYRTACLPAVNRSISAGRRRIISFYDQVTVRYADENTVSLYDPRGESFVNINTAAEYESWKREKGSFQEPS